MPIPNQHSIYAQQPVSDVENLLSTSIKNGLSEEEVLKRQEHYGKNEFQPKTSFWIPLLIRNIASPFIYLLVGATFLSVVLGDKGNALIMCIIILLHVILGFIQEYRSERAARLLAEYIISHARVIRENKQTLIESKNLVPGDMVLLSPGDAVPADIRLVESNNLTIDESALTGESVAVYKNAHDHSPAAEASTLVFLGTSVMSGSGTGIVIATGPNSVFGQISALTLMTPHESNFQHYLTLLSAFLIKLMVAMLFLILILNLIIKGDQVNFMQLLLFCLALAISVTPEALPVVTTFALAQGALALARHKVIVKRLSAIEDLGSITLLCTDKTGTLTENKLTVVETFPFKTQDPVLLAALGGEKTGSTNSFEVAAYQALQESSKQELTSLEIIRETPFDPVHRLTTKVVQSPSGILLVVRGSPDEVLSLCVNLDHTEMQALQAWEYDHGAQGHPVLALAIKKLTSSNLDSDIPETDLTLLGLIAFEDPVKKTVPEALKRASNLGIKIKVMTGDTPQVAGAVAYKLGLISSPSDVITGATLAQLPLAERHRAMSTYTVFARVTPEQKQSLVEYFKQYDTVGFLGDGINDAPALKAANVGIAVREASDIARSAADIVLVKKSLWMIIEAIAQGRTIFTNTVKYIKTTLSLSLGNFYSIAVASLFIEYLPMLPIQILLLNLLSDTPMIALATDNVNPQDLKRPAKYYIKDIALQATIFGIISSFFDFLIFGLFRHASQAELQTTWFLENSMTQIPFIFLMRTNRAFYRAARPSITLLALAIISITIAVGLPYTSLGKTFFHFKKPAPGTIILLVLISLSYLLLTEIVKNWYFKTQKNHASVPTNTKSNQSGKH